MSDSIFRDQPVLITGGLGFIGSNLARRLALLGARRARSSTRSSRNMAASCSTSPASTTRSTINIADVRDEYSMDYLVRGQAFIFNLAGQVSHLDSMHDPYTDLDINCRSQLSILEACRKHNPGVRIVYSGTRQVYGRPRYLPVDEQHPVDPVDVNGINKMAGRVVSHRLPPRLWPARHLAAPDQHLRPAHARRGRPPDLPGRVGQAAARRR